MKINVAKVFAVAAIASITTGCTASSSMFGGSDIQISATEAGMRAYGDHISAVITNGKASADADDTPAYKLRREQTVQETERKFGWKPNFKPQLNGVVGSDQGALPPK